MISFVEYIYYSLNQMLSKFNERQQGESVSRKKIIIPDIYNKSKEKKKTSYKKDL